MAEESGKEFTVGAGLVIRTVRGDALHEQDINAQEMSQGMFDRLVENIRQRGALESLPYCSQPDGEGTITIISGHHRVRAAVAAGLQEFPALIDTNPMPRSLIRAKQIAHNQLTGSPDNDVLAKMIEQIDNVDDMLLTGLDKESLPALNDSAKLDLPQMTFDWLTVELLFLPPQLRRLEDLVKSVGSADMVGAANYEQFSEFSHAMVKLGHVKNIKNMAAVVDYLTRIALREIEQSEDES